MTAQTPTRIVWAICESFAVFVASSLSLVVLVVVVDLKKGVVRK
jgi:hypothetical protein